MAVYGALLIGEQCGLCRLAFPSRSRGLPLPLCLCATPAEPGQYRADVLLAWEGKPEATVVPVHRKLVNRNLGMRGCPVVRVVRAVACSLSPRCPLRRWPGGAWRFRQRTDEGHVYLQHQRHTGNANPVRLRHLRRASCVIIMGQRKLVFL